MATSNASGASVSLYVDGKKTEVIHPRLKKHASQRGDEFRAVPLEYELRDSADTGMPTLVGHLAVFNEWTEINSRSEGHFLERIAPGAFTKTIQENLSRMRCLFNHGKDPVFAEKPLGPIVNLTPDERGLQYEVQLLDTSYNRDLVEMLRSDPPVLGSSFRFAVTRDDYVSKPGKSPSNPRGIPERTVQEVRMSEFGPVTFPAYPSAGAGVRSVTDQVRGLVDEDRADIPSLSCLMDAHAAMCGFIENENEPDDGPDRDKAQQIIALIEDLMPGEASEPDPDSDGPDDDVDTDEMVSQDGRGDEGAAQVDIRTSTIAHAVERHLLVSGRRDRTPLYPASRTERTESWRL